MTPAELDRLCATDTVTGPRGLADLAGLLRGAGMLASAWLLERATEEAADLEAELGACVPDADVEKMTAAHEGEIAAKDAEIYALEDRIVTFEDDVQKAITRFNTPEVPK